MDFKDRKKEVEHLRGALSLCGLPVSYEHADLIFRVVPVVKRLKGSFTIEDGMEISLKWEEDLKNNQKQKENESRVN